MAETDSFQPQVVVPGAQPQPVQDEQPENPIGPEQSSAAQAPLDTGTAFRSETDQSSQVWSGTATPDPAKVPNTAGLDDEPDSEVANHEPAITWTASEFIAHHKSSGWFGLLAVAAVVITGLVYLLTRDVISAAVVMLAAVLFGVTAARVPRQLEYQLNSKGIQIGSRYYRFASFRSFSVVPEGAFSSIIFMPMRRFSPLTTIYFDPKDESRIVDLLSNSLPFEDYKHDLVDQLMRRIRF